MEYYQTRYRDVSISSQEARGENVTLKRENETLKKQLATAQAQNDKLSRENYWNKAKVEKKVGEAQTQTEEGINYFWFLDCLVN